MLVIYHITLPSGISFPAEVKLRIPAAVSQPNAVAARLPDGSLINLQYTQKPAGDWNEITIAAATPTDQLQIEYYDDANLKKDGAQRQYAYRWPGDTRWVRWSFRFNNL